MTHGNDKQDFYVTSRLRTSTGMETLTHLIRHYTVKGWRVYSSGYSSAVGGSSLTGSTWTPDGASGWSTLVGTRSSRNRAIALHRKTVKALDLGVRNTAGDK